jgi:hypothetical protein
MKTLSARRAASMTLFPTLPGTSEGNEERVPLSIYFLARAIGERLAEKTPVFLEDLRVPLVTETLQERGGPLDVGEEESYGAGRQSVHSGLSPPLRPRSVRCDVRRAAAAVLECNETMTDDEDCRTRPNGLVHAADA